MKAKEINTKVLSLKELINFITELSKDFRTHSPQKAQLTNASGEALRRTLALSGDNFQRALRLNPALEKARQNLKVVGDLLKRIGPA